MTRLELHKIFQQIFENNNIYYQPPENIKIEYPALIYTKDNINIKYANNRSYIMKDRYMITIIDKRPDNQAIKKILNLENASYNRHYVSNGLNHDVLTIYV